MPRLQTEAGQWIDIAVVAVADGNDRSGVLDIESRYRDRIAEAHNRPARSISIKEKRVWLYQGYQPSLVPISQANYLMSQGFTAAPTKEAPAVDVACGIETFEGDPCHKMLRTQRDRVQHIRTVHADIAPWVLTPEDLARAGGKIIYNRTAGSTDPRVTALELKVDAVLEQLQRSSSPSMSF